MGATPFKRFLEIYKDVKNTSMMTDSLIFIHTAPSLCELIDRLLTCSGRLIVRLEFSSEKHQVHINRITTYLLNYSF